jgi:DNA-binding beta-propeller fold protein YncE
MPLHRLIVTLALAAGASVTSWSHPGSGIAVDDLGRVFFAAGPMIVMIATNGVARTIVHDQQNEKFYQLHHIQRTPDGGLATASDMGNAVCRFTPEGKLDRFYPPPNEDRPLSIGVGGDPFAIDRAGNLYAVNSRQDRFTQILRINTEGQIRVLAGGDWGFADGTGEQAKFSDLHGGSLLVAPDGAIILTEDYRRVRRLAPDGTVSTLAGGGERGYRDGPGTEARFDGASGIAINAQGNVLVVESVGRIRHISTNGIVSTLAGTAKGSAADGLLEAATFDEPTGIAVAPNGDLFVLEPHDPRVRKISGGHVVTILRGLP